MNGNCHRPTPWQPRHQRMQMGPSLLTSVIHMYMRLRAGSSHGILAPYVSRRFGSEASYVRLMMRRRVPRAAVQLLT
jgi:hypothetical protein